MNRNQNTLEIAQNIVIPESKHSVAILSQSTVSYRVCCRFIVLPAVHFNDQKSFAANKITDVAAYRLLPYKLVSVDLPVTNTIPENGFRVCLIDAQRSRDSDRLPIWPTHCPAPHPETPLRAVSDLSPQKSGER